jgi:5-enolpyruvylshikimate-3-phosphate synthase
MSCPTAGASHAARPTDATIETAGDHRIAMAFAIAALGGVAGRSR